MSYALGAVFAPILWAVIWLIALPPILWAIRKLAPRAEWLFFSPVTRSIPALFNCLAGRRPWPPPGVRRL